MWRPRRCKIRRATTLVRSWNKLSGRVTLTRANNRIEGQGDAKKQAQTKQTMKRIPKLILLTLAFGLAVGVGAPAQAQDKKPNIVFIMGDDIGMWNIGAYHRGMMAGKTPNLDKLAKEGMLFTDYYAEASCTAGRANFITGELPIRTGMTTVGQAGESD